MKLYSLAFAAAFALPAAALAQDAMPDVKAFAASADIQALVAKAKAQPPKPMISLPVAGAGAYRINLEYRSGPATPPIAHDADTEVMMVVDGSATVTTGGTMADVTHAGTNQIGSSISGGTARHVGKGDVLVVAAGSPHLVAPDAGAVAILTMHVPGVWAGH